MNYAAIDVETANSEISSICQIGIAIVKNWKIQSAHSILINPEGEFLTRNINIHGIMSQHVENSKLFPEIFPKLHTILKPLPLIHYGSFDQESITQACGKYELDEPELNWVNMETIARQQWPSLPKYKLDVLANRFGISFNHHDAKEDAITAAKLMMIACITTNRDMVELIEQARSTPNNSASSPEKSRPVLVFSGDMFAPKSVMKKIAESAGYSVAKNLTKKTNILCIGDTPDATFEAGNTKTGKHLKAEEYNLKGASIQILTEDEFLKLINYPGA